MTLLQLTFIMSSKNKLPNMSLYKSVSTPNLTTLMPPDSVTLRRRRSRSPTPIKIKEEIISKVPIITIDDVPLIWVHASEQDDQECGISEVFELKIREYFDIVFYKDLQQDQTKGLKVLGAIVVPHRYKLFHEQIKFMPELRIIANYGIQFSMLEFRKYEYLGVKISSTSPAVADGVADLAITLMLCSARNVVQG